jgi:hypothetical protein
VDIAAVDTLADDRLNVNTVDDQRPIDADAMKRQLFAGEISQRHATIRHSNGGNAWPCQGRGGEAADDPEATASGVFAC